MFVWPSMSPFVASITTTSAMSFSVVKRPTGIRARLGRGQSRIVSISTGTGNPPQDIDRSPRHCPS